MLSRTMHGFTYDPIHDEIVVNSPLSQAILTFRGAANGEEPPIRVIQGPQTKILGMAYTALKTVTSDPAHNEIFLPVGDGGYRDGGQGSGEVGVLVFDREANGDVPPKRFLRGPATQITTANPQVAVDPVRDLLIVSNSGKLLIFDRTASGNTPPLRVIGGPVNRTGGGQLVTYPEKGYIVAGSMGGYAVWSVDDEGDVAPRWRIPVEQILGGRQNVGIAVIPAHKEIMVSAARLNRVVTFYFPEMFE